MNRLFSIILCSLVLMCSNGLANAQGFGPQVPGQVQSQLPLPSSQPNSISEINPLNLLNDAGMLVQGASNLGSGVNPNSGSPGEQRGGMSVAINIMLLLTVIALVPSVMLMTTSFVRIMVVLALLRQAMGTQSLPPAQVVTGLALFMTALVMKPTIDRIWTDAVVPYQYGEIREMDVLWERASTPMRDYMFDQIEASDNWSSLYMILNYQGVDTSSPENITRADISTVSLVPAYMLSELKVAFLMGFRVYLPFLVMVDGWSLIIGSLLESFVQEGGGARASAVTAGMLPLLLIIKIKHAPSLSTNQLYEDSANQTRGFRRRSVACDL